MQEVAISKFKAKCLALLEEVQKTKKPIRVTRFGISESATVQCRGRSVPIVPSHLYALGGA